MSEYRWCLFKNGSEDKHPTYVWYHADEVKLHDLPEDFFYHRMDGPFAKNKSMNRFGWWYKGESLYFNEWLKINVKLGDEEKALLILEFA